jgi:hypothetical protein
MAAMRGPKQFHFEGEIDVSENEEVRRQFEAWHGSQGFKYVPEQRASGKYVNGQVQGNWLAYQAAYQAALSSPAVVALVEADRLIDKCDAALESHRESNVYDEAWAATQLEIHRTRDLAVKRRAEALVRIAPFTTGERGYTNG